MAISIPIGINLPLLRVPIAPQSDAYFHRQVQLGNARLLAIRFKEAPGSFWKLLEASIGVAISVAAFAPDSHTNRFHLYHGRFYCDTLCPMTPIEVGQMNYEAADDLCQFLNSPTHSIRDGKYAKMDSERSRFLFTRIQHRKVNTRRTKRTVLYYSNSALQQ